MTAGKTTRATLRFSFVDVFAERRYEGNQLAVFPGPVDMDAVEMQSIAREINFSETSFVTAHTAGNFRVRIFTPNEELPFAGHPTLGTAAVVANGSDRLVLAFSGGDVDVWRDNDVWWMTPPDPQLGPPVDPTEAAALLGLDVADLHPDWPPRTIRCGPSFTLIPLRSLATLQQATIDTDRFRAGSLGRRVFLVCAGGYTSGGDFAARMLSCNDTGVREDAATGSANSAFAAELRALGRNGHYTVEQGYGIGRPSRIRLDVGTESVAVGGRVRHVADGRWADIPTAN